MSLITLTLLIGLSFGANATSNFDPEIITYTCSKCMVVWFLEALLFKFIFYVMGVPGVTFMDVLCVSGYKFCLLVFAQIVDLIGGPLACALVCVYLGGCMALFMVKSLKRFTHHNTIAERIGNVSSSRSTILIVMGVCQFPLLLFLAYH